MSQHNANTNGQLTLRPSVPEAEVLPKPKRRTFTAAYKLRVLHEADQCSESGAVGALLRREGLYSSHLVTWRRQRQQGHLQALSPQKRGRKVSPEDKLRRELAKLHREKEQLEHRLHRAETIIEAQKKVCALFDLPTYNEQS